MAHSQEAPDYFRLVEENRELNRREIEQGFPRLQSTPLFFKIDSMGVCNMRPYCCTCDLDEENPVRHKGLDLDTLASCGSQFDRAERIWDGSTGEALLHPRFLDFIESAARKGKTVGFTTGGLALSPKRADRLLPFLAHLSMTVSFDAATPETFAKLRGNRFEEIVANFRHLLDRRREFPAPLPGDLGICFIPMRTNRHEIEPLFDLAASLGVDFVVFRPMHHRPVNKIVQREGFTFNYFEEMLSEEELEECRVRGAREADRVGIRFMCQYQVTGEDRFQEYKPSGYERVAAPCLMPWRFVKLIHDGQTFPCVYITESMGNWKEEGLDTVWNNPKWQRLRSQLAEGAPAALCYRAPSCPVVIRALEQQREVELAALVRRSLQGGLHRIHLCDKAAFFLLEQGLYEPDLSAGEGREFRWLGPEAVFNLPNPFPGEAGWGLLPLRTNKPDLAHDPLKLTVQVDQDEPVRVTLGNPRGGVVWLHFPAVLEKQFQISVRTFNPWIPKEHPECLSPKDGRLLSAQVTEVLMTRSRVSLLRAVLGMIRRDRVSMGWAEAFRW